MPDPYTVTITAKSADSRPAKLPGRLSYVYHRERLRSERRRDHHLSRKRDTRAAIPSSPLLRLGTGPFMLKDFVPGDHATMVRNPNYFEAGVPYLSEVKFLYLPQPTTQVAAVQSGQADFITVSDPGAGCSPGE